MKKLDLGKSYANAKCLHTWQAWKFRAYCQRMLDWPHRMSQNSDISTYLRSLSVSLPPVRSLPQNVTHPITRSSVTPFDRQPAPRRPSVVWWKMTKSVDDRPNPASRDATSLSFWRSPFPRQSRSDIAPDTEAARPIAMSPFEDTELFLVK